MKRAYLKIALFFLITVFFAGCASMPVAETTAQKIAYAKYTGKGLTTGVKELLMADAITVEDSEAYLAYIEDSKSLLNTAEYMLGKGDEMAAMDNWQKANQILLMLNNYLLEKQKGGQ